MSPAQWGAFCSLLDRCVTALGVAGGAGGAGATSADPLHERLSAVAKAIQEAAEGGATLAVVVGGGGGSGGGGDLAPPPPPPLRLNEPPPPALASTAEWKALMGALDAFNFEASEKVWRFSQPLQELKELTSKLAPGPGVPQVVLSLTLDASKGVRKAFAEVDAVLLADALKRLKTPLPEEPMRLTAEKAEKTAFRRAQGACSFGGLLQALDSINAQVGRLVILTTNHREKLDPALIRDGRIDRALLPRLVQQPPLNPHLMPPPPSHTAPPTGQLHFQLPGASELTEAFKAHFGLSHTDLLVARFRDAVEEASKAPLFEPVTHAAAENFFRRCVAAKDGPAFFKVWAMSRSTGGEQRFGDAHSAVATPGTWGDSWGLSPPCGAE
jgi:hypothetical protein